MYYLSAKAFAHKNDLSIRWVQELCKKGKIPGVTRLNGDGAWMIPENASIITVHKSNVSLKGEKKMVNAENQMKTGQLLLNQGDLGMAAVYFEFAGEEFLRRKDYTNALVAYEKTLYCFETDENMFRVEEIKGIIATIKQKMEE